MSPHKSALVQASLPIAFGIIGFLKLGHFHWGIFALGIVATGFAYWSGYSRAKFGTPPIKSAIFGEIPGKPPQR